MVKFTHVFSYYNIHEGNHSLKFVNFIKCLGYNSSINFILGGSCHCFKTEWFLAKNRQLFFIPISCNCTRLIFQTGVDDKGLIQYLILNYYQDDGCNKNDSIASSTLYHMDSIYDMSTWTIYGYGVKTDLPSQTWCRSPGEIYLVYIV